VQELLAAREITINEEVGVTVHTDGAVDPGRPADTVLASTVPADTVVVDLTAEAPTGVPVDELDELSDDEEDGVDGVDDPVVAGAVDLVLVETDGLPPELAWQERALCAQTDPEAFFPEKGGSTREAKRVCMSCEVRAECLDYALAKDERFGIWGGLSERERRRVKKQAV